MISDLQDFIDDYANKTSSGIDYIHGDAAALKLASGGNCAAIILPEMDKRELFETVKTKGVFPRKSFSVGHANEKRYYLECRKIR
jgi:hypothetical protein